MSTIRTFHNKENPYVQINKKSLWDPELSLEAIGLWSRLLSRPDDWVVSVKELTKSCHCGKDRINRIINELVSKGYAHRIQTRKESPNSQSKKHLYSSYETYVFESKMSKDEIKKMFTETCFPAPINPGPINPHTTNIESIPTKVDIDKKEKDKSQATPVVSADAERLSELLFSKMKEVDSKFKTPNLKNWSIEMDRLLRLDERDPKEVEEMIAFIKQHWYGVNINCVKSLRDKFSVIVGHYKQYLQKAEDQKTKKPIVSKSLIAEHEKYAKEIELNYSKKVASGTISIGYNYIEFVYGQRSVIIKFADCGFREQVDSNLRKLGLK